MDFVRRLPQNIKHFTRNQDGDVTAENVQFPRVY
jgi:hypothetical protein